MSVLSKKHVYSKFILYETFRQLFFADAENHHMKDMKEVFATFSIGNYLAPRLNVFL